MPRRRFICVALAILALSACSGGPRRAEVSGTVKLNGALVAEGAINFFPMDGTTGPEAGAPIKDGKFHIPRDKGAVVGKQRVVLKAFGKTGKRIQDPTAPPGTMIDEIGNLFPPDCNNLDSQIVREITSGENKFDFDISSKGKNK